MEPLGARHLDHLGHAFVFPIVVDTDVHAIAAREGLLDVGPAQGVALHELEGFGKFRAGLAGMPRHHAHAESGIS